MSRTTLLAALAATAAALTALPATAQDASLQANFGSVTLASGFPNDPNQVRVVSGGNIDASTAIGQGCRGMISRAPDYQVTYTAGSLPLAFYTQSDSDTTLVINGPDGRWACDDDSGGNLNARVLYSRPQSGVYDVWVGSFGGGNHSATLSVTELP